MARILIIDDQDFVRDVERRILESVGHQVLTARDGEEGVQVLRRERIDLLVCDVFMPDRDGLEVIREVRREYPGVRIVAVSGGSFDSKQDVLPATLEELGADATLHKPFNSGELCAVVDEVLRRPPPGT
jgi:DNA-binding response OmpR family regulator